jgi:hypothetical protein
LIWDRAGPGKVRGGGAHFRGGKPQGPEGADRANGGPIACSEKRVCFPASFLALRCGPAAARPAGDLCSLPPARLCAARAGFTSAPDRQLRLRSGARGGRLCRLSGGCDLLERGRRGRGRWHQNRRWAGCARHGMRGARGRRCSAPAFFLLGCPFGAQRGQQCIRNDAPSSVGQLRRSSGPRRQRRGDLPPRPPLRPPQIFIQFSNDLWLGAGRARASHSLTLKVGWAGPAEAPPPRAPACRAHLLGLLLCCHRAAACAAARAAALRLLAPLL